LLREVHPSGEHLIDQISSFAHDQAGVRDRP
jgi:hypothetical protein